MSILTNRPVFVRCDANFMWDSDGLPYDNKFNHVDSQNFIEEERKLNLQLKLSQTPVVEPEEKSLKICWSEDELRAIEEERVNYASKLQKRHESRVKWANDIDDSVKLRREERLKNC